MQKTKLIPLALISLTAACAQTTVAPTTASSNTEPAPALADNAPTAASADETWASLDDTERYLLIMGAVDGFAAAGAGAPCFPGKDNAALDEDLNAAGFANGDPVTLPAQLAALSASPAECQAAAARGYDSSLLQSMPDEHLATYLTGAIRGYATVATCAPQNHSYAAGLAIASVFETAEPTPPAMILGDAFKEGCQGVPE